MSWRSRPEAWGLALVLALFAAGPRTARAQGWRETQVWAVGLAARPAVAAAGLGLAVRDVGRTRLGFALAAGTAEGGRAAGRAEFAWHFLLDPGRRRGLGLYGGAGAALTVVEGNRVRPFVLGVLGIETAPAAPTGVFVESGFGGGVRRAAGLRWRRHRGR
jgi:hypothetical protein